MPTHRSARELAEELKHLAGQGTDTQDRISLLKELQAYQEELSVQSEKLRQAQATADQIHNRFIDLYDFAWSGYLTLNGNGTIRQINLAGASLLGKPRRSVEGLPLEAFIVPGDRARWQDFLQQCRAAAGQPNLTGEFTFQSGTLTRDIQIICRPSCGGGADAPHDLLAALIDLTDQRRRDAERALTAREHTALTTRLLSAQDEERRRIGRDLHDNVGQQLTALRLILQIAAMSDERESVRSRLEQAQAIVEQIDRDLDILSNELRPASLDLGIASAVELFVTEWSTTFGIAADVRCAPLDPGCVAPDAEMHLYRVVQEALNNVYKHAGARRVSVALERHDSDVVLTIADDGCGFDATELERLQGRGRGLVGMRERAHLVGGAFDLHSERGKGTTISLRVPIADRTESR